MHAVVPRLPRRLCGRFVRLACTSAAPQGAATPHTEVVPPPRASTPSASVAHRANLASYAAFQIVVGQDSGRSLLDAVALLGEYQALGEPLTHKVASTALSAYAELRCYHLCVALFRHWLATEPEFKLAAKALKQVIMAAAAIDDHAALRLGIEQMKTSGYTVPPKYLQKLLTISISNGTEDEMEAILELLKSDPTPSPHLYHAFALKALHDGDVHKGAAMLQHLFFVEEWPSHYVFRGRVYRKVLGTLLHKSVATHDTSSMYIGLQILNFLSLKTHFSTLTRMLLAAANQGHAELARLAMATMEECGYPIKVHHLNAGMHAFAKGGEITAAVEVAQELARMNEAADPSALEELAMAITGLWKRTGQQSVMNMESFMPEGIVPADIVTCMLRVYASSGYYFPAQSLFESATVLHGVQPTPDTYAALMQCYAHPRSPRVSAALDLAQEMESKGIAFNSACYSALATCLLRSWHHTTEQAYEMVSAASNVGTPVSYDTYAKFVKVHVRSGDLDAMRSVIRDLKAAGYTLRPTLEAYLARYRPKPTSPPPHRKASTRKVVKVTSAEGKEAEE